MNYESLLSANVLTIDDERRAAHRSEIKRALAGITVKKIRVEELRNIAAKLNADSDRAAESHGVDAGRLQAELDRLDAEQIEHVLAGKSTPAKAIERRRQILDELTRLNKILEMTCEANRRAAVPIERQFNSLRMETTSEGALRNQLGSLCSVDLRRQKMLCDMKLQYTSGMLKNAQRSIEIHESNAEICKTNQDSPAVHVIKLADAKAIVERIEAETQALHEEAAELHRQSLAE